MRVLVNGVSKSTELAIGRTEFKKYTKPLMAGQIKESEKVSKNFLRNSVMFYILRVCRSVYFTFFLDILLFTFELFEFSSIFPNHLRYS